MEPSPGDSWPSARANHAACCLNYDKTHPKLLVHGGLDKERSVLGDMWMLDVNSGKWTEVRKLMLVHG